MNIFSRIKGWIETLFASRIKDEFDIEPLSFPETERFVAECVSAYSGSPSWIDAERHIKTINFAKSVCSEVARLTTLGAKLTVSGSARGEYLQKQIDGMYFQLRHWVEYAAANGTVILKPRENGVDMIPVSDFEVTEIDNGKIRGAVFSDRYYDAVAKKWYTRLEWHRFNTAGEYLVSNRCYVADTEHGTGKPIDIKKTVWNSLEADVSLLGVEDMLFGVLRMPEANNFEPNSPLGLPIFAGAIQELKDLDVAYSRNAKEIFDSRRTVLLDSDRLVESGTRVRNMNTTAKIENAGLPDFVKLVQGAGANDDIYHEINPTLNTATRLNGINALLSQIGYKCGFSNGYFVFNESSGIQTATQVEADQQRTIQLIKDIRDKLESCLTELLYALDKFADIYDLAPVGTYEVNFDFGDITYNIEEDRARWLTFVTQGKIAFWRYLVKFEGFTEEEAKLIEAETQSAPTLFAGNEYAIT